MTTNFICLACGKEKEQSPRSNGRQSYCGLKSCQKARKASSQRHRLSVDSDYRANQRRCYQAWAKNNPEYWDDYRKSHPQYVERNRLLQRQRNQKRRAANASRANTDVIAKMDALDFGNGLKLHGNVECWLIPVIAKMDALKVKIAVILESSA